MILDCRAKGVHNVVRLWFVADGHGAVRIACCSVLVIIKKLHQWTVEHTNCPCDKNDIVHRYIHASIYLYR